MSICALFWHSRGECGQHWQTMMLRLAAGGRYDDGWIALVADGASPCLLLPRAGRGRCDVEMERTCRWCDGSGHLGCWLCLVSLLMSDFTLCRPWSIRREDGALLRRRWVRFQFLMALSWRGSLWLSGPRPIPFREMAVCNGEAGAELTAQLLRRYWSERG